MLPFSLWLVFNVSTLAYVVADSNLFLDNDQSDVNLFLNDCESDLKIAMP